MEKTIPQQHPAVVLRSHYKQLRSMLAAAIIAVVGLSAAVVILATNDDASPTASSVAPVTATTSPHAARFDGGPEEGTRGASTAAPATRFDGGPEEGSHDLRVTRTVPPDLSVSRSAPHYDGRELVVPQPQPTARPDGGPEEGSQDIQLRRSAPNPDPTPIGGARP